MRASTRKGASAEAPRLNLDEEGIRSLGLSGNISTWQRDPLSQAERLGLGGLLLSYMYNDGKIIENPISEKRTPKSSSMFTSYGLVWDKGSNYFNGSSKLVLPLLKVMSKIRTGCYVARELKEKTARG